MNAMYYSNEILAFSGINISITFINKQRFKRLLYSNANEHTYVPPSHYSVPSQSIRAFNKNGIATRTFIARIRIICKFVEIDLLYQSTEKYEE